MVVPLFKYFIRYRNIGQAQGVVPTKDIKCE